jgi:hypothetical protein
MFTIGGLLLYLALPLKGHYMLGISNN